MVTCPLLVIFTARISLGEFLLAVCTVVHRPTSVNCDAGRPGDIDYEHVDLRASRLGQAINISRKTIEIGPGTDDAEMVGIVVGAIVGTRRTGE